MGGDRFYCVCYGSGFGPYTDVGSVEIAGAFFGQLGELLISASPEISNQRPFLRIPSSGTEVHALTAFVHPAHQEAAPLS